jgi:hypothetical protein
MARQKHNPPCGIRRRYSLPFLVMGHGSKGRLLAGKRSRSTIERMQGCFPDALTPERVVVTARQALPGKKAYG